MRAVKWLVIVALAFLSSAEFADAQVKRRKWNLGAEYLIIEILDDDLVHCEMSATGSAPALTNPLYASPMVHKRDYAGPALFSESGNVLETAALKIEVDPLNLCVKFTDKAN